MRVKTFLYILVLACVTVVLTPPAQAQFFGAGLKLGAPLTDAFHNQGFPTFAAFSASSSHFTVGPYVEVRLPISLSLEVDALHRGYDYRNAGISASNSSWEFPVLAKYKLLHGPIRPYLEGGISFLKLTDVARITSIAAINHANTAGIVLGGGIEIKAAALRVSPEIRYTGYTLLNFDSLIRTNRNQATFLVGIGF